MLLSIFLTCVLLGSVVGFCAGLLGIGGGLIIVPALVYLLPQLGIEPNLVMPMALATSLATIVITSLSAALAHHRNSNIPWPLAKLLMLSIALGSLLGAFIADMLSVEALKNTFAIAVFLLSSYMFIAISRAKKNKLINNSDDEKLPNNIIIKLIGFFTGILASLMGIAGGAILVPVLSYFKVPLRQSIGVATVSGMVVAIFGVSGYVIAGFGEEHLPQYSLGYVYLPALLGIIITSSFFAPIGVKAASKLPVSTIKKAFAIFLMLVALKMILS
ncbi:MAG: putative membrane protein YfcA [Colwellia sp.]|jgi:uncharacterized membrane protein YfcA|uniref:sulfite exporter TauE/SafE family protein n=1 Tax=Colwellia sp. Bg11-12 TaxID=2759817 RepID=UPI0015F59F2B|nr:sulfite exporter TauE/SafE family protein [Colwellia sp. Bg11-12]MBA6263080.1 sulfite exporter TauE/SafE family protein [Colwellia sp. Bg11-12]